MLPQHVCSVGEYDKRFILIFQSECKNVSAVDTVLMNVGYFVEYRFGQGCL